MNTTQRGTNVTIFLLFFGIAMLEAIASGSALAIVFWLAIGSVFLLADRVGRKSDQ